MSFKHKSCGFFSLVKSFNSFLLIIPRITYKLCDVIYRAPWFWPRFLLQLIPWPVLSRVCMSYMFQLVSSTLLSSTFGIFYMHPLILKLFLLPLSASG